MNFPVASYTAGRLFSFFGPPLSSPEFFSTHRIPLKFFLFRFRHPPYDFPDKPSPKLYINEDDPDRSRTSVSFSFSRLWEPFHFRLLSFSQIGTFLQATQGLLFPRETFFRLAFFFPFLFHGPPPVSLLFPGRRPFPFLHFFPRVNAFFFHAFFDIPSHVYAFARGLRRCPHPPCPPLNFHAIRPFSKKLFSPFFLFSFFSL